MSAICGVCYAEYATSDEDLYLPYGCDCSKEDED